jgi:hypothetical protein
MRRGSVEASRRARRRAQNRGRAEPLDAELEDAVVRAVTEGAFDAAKVLAA